MKLKTAGFTVMEVVVTLAVVAILLMIVAQIHLEYVRFDRDATKSLFRHPQLGAVTSRVRADVLAATAYPVEYEGYSQSADTLIVQLEGAPPRYVVWEFGGGVASRRVFEPGHASRTWRAEGLPAFAVSAVQLAEDRRSATRLTAVDEEGKVVFDGVFQPRIR